MKRRDLERKLRDLGGRRLRTGRRPDIRMIGELEVAVPRHDEINEYTAAAILRAAGKGQS